MTTSPPSPAGGAATALLDRLARAGNTLGTAVIWLLAVAVTYDVALRSLGTATLWAGEVSTYLMIALAFLGAGATQQADGHFRVTFVLAHCPPRVRGMLELLAAAMALAFSLLCTVGAWQATESSWLLDMQTSTLLRVPLWLLQGLMVAGGVLLALAYVQRILALARGGLAVAEGVPGAGEVI